MTPTPEQFHALEKLRARVQAAGQAPAAGVVGLTVREAQAILGYFRKVASMIKIEKLPEKGLHGCNGCNRVTGPAPLDHCAYIRANWKLSVGSENGACMVITLCNECFAELQVAIRGLGQAFMQDVINATPDKVLRQHVKLLYSEAEEVLKRHASYKTWHSGNPVLGLVAEYNILCTLAGGCQNCAEGLERAGRIDNCEALQKCLEDALFNVGYLQRQIQGTAEVAETYRKAQTVAKLDNIELQERLAAAEKQLNLSASELCARYHVQNCHRCEDLRCGDNMSPWAKKYRVALDYIETLLAAITQAKADGHQLEPFGPTCREARGFLEAAGKVLALHGLRCRSEIVAKMETYIKAQEVGGPYSFESQVVIEALQWVLNLKDEDVAKPPHQDPESSTCPFCGECATEYRTTYSNGKYGLEYKQRVCGACGARGPRNSNTWGRVERLKK